MHTFAVAALFAAFITTEQLLASAMVGVGVALVFSGFTLIRKNRKMLAEMDQPTTDLDDEEPISEKTGGARKPGDIGFPLAGVLLFMLGVALLIGGIIWRIDAER